MTHERGRFIFTLAGIFIPGIMAISIFPIALFVKSEIGAIIAVLLILLSVLFGLVGHAAFIMASIFWNCPHCGRRYFDFFMPYWPLQSTCQNCHLAD
jgi:hypothetical protein